MSDKKRKIVAVLLILSGLIISILIGLILFVSSLRDGVIRNAESGSYYKIRNLFVLGNYAFIRRSSDEYDSKKAAFVSESALSLALVETSKISLIDYDSADDSKKPSVAEGAYDKWSISFKDYVGEYKVNAAGNVGYLFLRARNGVVYGSVRFPQWGKGMIEPLKNVRITNGNIKFTRSALSSAELKKLGITAPFVQEYSGSYLHSGRSIRGTYLVQGLKKNWEADKIK